MKAELSHAKLFELVLEEALRDGTVDEREFEKVDVLKSVLCISDEQHQEAFKRVAARLAARKPAPRALDRVALYEKLLAAAAADGTVSKAERSCIRIAKELLGLSDDDHRTAVARVKAWLEARRAKA